MGKNLWAGIFRLITVCILFIILLLFIYYGILLFYPFLIGFLLAYWIQPMIRFLENRFSFKRTSAVFLAVFLLFATFMMVLLLLLTQIYQHTGQLFHALPHMFGQFLDMYQVFFENHLLPVYEKTLLHFQHLDTHTRQKIFTAMQNFGTNLMQSLEHFIHALFQSVLHGIQSLPAALTTILLALLAAFFLAKDWERFCLYFARYVPNGFQQRGQMLFFHLQRALFGWLKAQLILISFSALLVLIGLLILRIPYAFILTICIAFVDLLPLLGTGMIFLPWIFAVLLTGKLPLAIALLVLYILVIIQRQILEPKILSETLNIDPLAALVTVFVGFRLFGFWGLIVGPALLVIGMALHQAGIFSDIRRYIRTGRL